MSRTLGDRLAEQQLKYNELMAQEPNPCDEPETACVDPQYINPKKRYVPKMLDRLEKERYVIKDVLTRRENVEELTGLLEKNPDVARILDLMRELGL